jgi:hypothetical protein
MNDRYYKEILGEKRKMSAQLTLHTLSGKVNFFTN